MRLLSWIRGAALAAALCAPAAAQTVTLEVQYSPPAFARFHDPIAQEFLRAHPDVRLNFRQGFPTYDEQHLAVMRQALTNQLPDVYFTGFHLLPETVRQLARRNQAVDLTPLLAAEGQAWVAANYLPRILALGQVDGRQYGMAANASSPIMYFNPELVRRAGGDPERMPDSWDGIVALAGRIKALAPEIDGMAYNVHDWTDDWLWRALVLQGGGRILNDAGDAVAFDNAAGLAALRLARRFVAEGGMQMIARQQSEQQFAAGRIGIYFSSPSNLQIITQLVGERFPLRTTTFPITDRASGALPTGGNAAMILTQDPARQRAAWAYVKFVTGPVGQRIAAELTGYLPTNRIAAGPDYLGPVYERNPNMRTVVAQIERSVPWEGYPGTNAVRIWRAQKDIITAVMRGELAPDLALAQMVAESNRLMR